MPFQKEAVSVPWYPLELEMKRIILALIIAMVAMGLSACDGVDSDVAEAQAVLPSDAIEGLWVSTVMYNSANRTDRFLVPSSNLIYFSLKNADANPIDATLYTKHELDNCYINESGLLTYVGDNLYRDENSRDTLDLRLSQDKLTMYFEINGISVVAEFDPVTGLTEGDLPVCTPSEASLQDDSPSRGLNDYIKSTVKFILAK